MNYTMASALPEDENGGILKIPEKRREFDELVAVRGMEFRRKVEEKREMDLQMIKLRQYLTPDSECLPTGAFTLLQNNQVWDIVLQYLSHSFDIDSAERTCPTFQGIRLRKTPTGNPGEREVSAVLKIMKKDKYLESSNSNWWLPQNHCHVPWHLRLISKSWQRATDQAFLKEFKGEWHLELAYGRWLKDDVDVKVLNLTDLDRAWTILGNSHSRASLLQIIRLDESCLAEIGIMHSRVLEFLDEYGEHIKGLIVTWNEKTTSFSSKYLNLLSLMSRISNLKALTIDEDLYPYPPSREEDMEALKDSIFRHPFPDCSSIEVLSVLSSYYLLEPIVAEIISRCNKLKSIYLRELVLENEVTRILAGRSIQVINTFTSLSKEMMPWASQFPLRKIIIERWDFKTCSERLSFVNLFGNTLEYLQLPIDSKLMGEPVMLQLPKLKHLNLRAWPGLPNLDFLISLQSLEYLEFTYNVYFEKYKNPEDKFHLIEVKDFDALEKSNIWRCFPHLRILKFDVYQKLDLDDDQDDEVVYSIYDRFQLDEAYRERRQWFYEYLKKGTDITKKLKCGILQETSCGYNFSLLTTS